MNRTSPKWLTCQINGVADYICNAPAPPDVLYHLAYNFRRAAERVEAEIRRREAVAHEYADDGVFG
jgi:hypothetical protein